MQDKPLTKEDVIRIIREESQKNMLSGTPRVAPHNHDGNNGFKIEQKNIIPSIKGNALLMSTTSEIFTINVTSSPLALYFYGYAANNAAGGSATKRATIHGAAHLGVGYNFSPVVSNNVVVPGPAQNIVQCCNSMYVDAAGVGNTRVYASKAYLVYAGDGTSAVATAQVIDFTDKSITIQTVLASGWQITGNFLAT